MRLQYIDTELSVPDVVVQFVSLAFLSFADTEKKETKLAWCIRKRFFFIYTTITDSAKHRHCQHLGPLLKSDFK